MAGLMKSAVGEGKPNEANDVRMVQTLLNRHTKPTPNLAADGKFGDRTEKAIIAFQKQEKLKPDGVMGVSGETIKKLLAYTSASFEKLPLQGTGCYGKLPASELYGTKETIASLQAAGRALAKQHKLEFGVVDISLSTGGYFPPHKTHRLGCQVDIRPLRTDDEQAGTSFGDDSYSQEKTAKLVKILLADSNVASILFNDTTITGVTSQTGHSNHLHVNFKK